MPIISSIGSSSASSTSGPQKAELKPIGICLPTNSSLEMSNSSTTIATNRVTTTSSNQNYYNSSSQSSGASPIPVSALSVMVARFTADANSRQQTVILHPRPIGAGNRAALQMNASIRGSTVISGQTMCTTGSTPSLTSSSASISVRTTHLIGGQQHPNNALPILNLSTVSNANTSGISSHSSSTVKQICAQSRPFISTSGPLPIESVSLVMANPNEPNVVNARPIRLHPTGSELKQNTTIHNINKLNSRTAVMTGSTLMTTQPTKMAISIGGSGAQTANTVSAQHVARVGIIGQLPMGSGGTTATNKSGIINLPKGHFIFNSPTTTNLNSGNTTLHNMVNVSGSVASFATTAQSSPQMAKLSVNSNANNIITNRHSVVSTTPFIHQNMTHMHPQHTQPSHRSTVHQNANSNSLQTPSAPQTQLLLQPTTTVSTTSPLRPTILSSPANSPVKQSQLQASTPSSPRPSILIRKRIANDSQTSLTPTALFKTTAPNTTMTGPTTPLRVANYSLKANDLSSSHTSVENRVNDTTATTDATVAANCTTGALPTTPNSEGNQTPRKKPRKQLLEPSSLKSSQNMRSLTSSANNPKPDVCNDKESVVRLNKKPRVSLLSSYNMGWKSLQYHFLRYSDVRPKPEKKLTLSELSNEGLQRRNGWKIHHLATQMELMTDNEDSVHQRLNQFLDTFESDVSALTSQCSNSGFPNNVNNTSATSGCNVVANCESVRRTVGTTGAEGSGSGVDSIAIKLNDLIRGNLQRSHLFSDQINEARQLIIKLTTDHKDRVGKITKKCANKRTYITK